MTMTVPEAQRRVLSALGVSQPWTSTPSEDNIAQAVAVHASLGEAIDVLATRAAKATALAELIVEHEQEDTPLILLAYRLIDSGRVQVSL